MKSEAGVLTEDVPTYFAFLYVSIIDDLCVFDLIVIQRIQGIKLQYIKSFPMASNL